jgi:SAM-dependent methyltransferase
MSKSREQLNEFLSHIDIQGKSVLDVGVQDKPAKNRTKGEPKSYWTLDIDESWSPDIVGDLNLPWEEFVTNVWQAREKVDVIFCLETLEHVWDPVQALKNMANVLKKGGIMYLSTPFINPHHDIHDYLRYTNEWYRDVLPYVGLKVINIRERTASAGLPLLRAFYDAEGLRVSKIRPEFGHYTYPIGYFVEAIKNGDET